MDYIKVKIETTSEGADPLCALLTDVGITGFEIEDRRDFDDFVENCKDKYDYIDESLLNAPANVPTVSFYVAANGVGMDTISQAKALLNNIKDRNFFGSLFLSTENVAEQSWAETWKRFFHCTPIGQKILVVPQWEISNVKDDSRIPFIINPGMVFGTGTHESTKLCIEMAEKYVKPCQSILDLGCGSGILSIVARLLGAGYAKGVDIDNNALENAYSNAKLNNINDNFEVLIGDVTEKTFSEKLGNNYDVVFANIVASVIVGLAPYIRRFLNDEGIFITSGIIEQRKDEVVKALTDNGLSVIEASTERGWVCLVLQKQK